jgi:hypothetical protein
VDWLGIGFQDIVTLVLVVVISTLGAAAIRLVSAVTSPPPPPRSGWERQEARELGEQRERRLEIDDVLQAAGIDRTMAKIFYARLKTALDRGVVKPALVASECDGHVLYDFARDDWVCMSRNGVAYPLGSSPEGEKLEIEEG